MSSLISKISILSIFSLILLLSSCSTTNTYSHRKKKKYQNSSSYVKASPRKQNKTRPSTYNSSGTGIRGEIIAEAKKHIGKKYVYGGKSASGFDCSGFTSYVYRKVGVPLNGPSHSQSKQGEKVAVKSLHTGDLLFFGNRSKVSHVAIVVESNNKELWVIHSTSSRGVVMEDISNSSYWQKKLLYGRNIIDSGLASK